MGDRANVKVKDGDDAVFLYTHWHGSDLPTILQAALRRGKGRWDDEQYLARIIFCEMIKDDVMGETGFGISAHVGDGADRVLTVAGEQVTTGDKSWSFKQYVELSPDDLDKVWDD